MTEPYKNPISPAGAVTEFFWRLLGVAALVGCSVLGWYLFELSRRNNLDNEFALIFRATVKSLNTTLKLDPVLGLIVYPFAIFVIAVLIALFFWLRRDR